MCVRVCDKTDCSVLSSLTCSVQGFGFVTLATSEDADRARQHLHTRIIDGRKIEVQLYGSVRTYKCDV